MISCFPHSSDLHDRLDRTKQKKEKLEMEIYRTELQTYLQMVREQCVKCVCGREVRDGDGDLPH